MTKEDEEAYLQAEAYLAQRQICRAKHQYEKETGDVSLSHYPSTPCLRHFCAHASGQFKDSKKNYHVIYKEILVVKYGIKKFEFHLISHKFLINMDNSSFPESLTSRTNCYLTSNS